MEQQLFYTEQIRQQQLLLRRIKNYRNTVTLLKLLAFASLIVESYRFIEHESLHILFPVLSVAAFIALSQLDSRIVRRRQYTEKLLNLNEGEIAARKGDFSSFPTGEEFIDSTHPYSADLDLFGEDSLFRQLNRTATAEGRLCLAQWMQHPCTDRKTLQERQEAVAELAGMPEWCLQFRAHSTADTPSGTDNETRREWQNASPIIRHPRATRLFLYLMNALTLACWGIVIGGWLPLSFALGLSSIQLLLISCYVGKINSCHRRLDRLIRNLSRYLPAIRLIDRRTFQSAALQNIRRELFNPDRNALQAFTRLSKIQERLDQRANVLLAFLLDGLYMKDMHTLFLLEQWQQEYADHLDRWIGKISETDALVSLATYHFNHPGYTFPIIDDTVILDAREAGHPLIHGKTCVTNDFRIGKERQLHIITGANMAGKSTFLRTIGINLVLAQMGSVVRSSRFAFRPTALFTSMRTTDNLAKETSYFHAELIRLRQLVRTANENTDLFIILDEMLKGTNSADKLKGSFAFLLRLSDLPVSGLVATHDLALSELHEKFPGRFINACFEITHCGNQINYDYKLRSGVANTMNATLLMQQMGLI